MKIPIAILIELAALSLAVAAVAVAVGLWPSLLAGGAALAYMAHAWDWEDGSVKLRPLSLKFLRRRRVETPDA